MNVYFTIEVIFDICYWLRVNWKYARENLKRQGTCYNCTYISLSLSLLSMNHYTNKLEFSKQTIDLKISNLIIIVSPPISTEKTTNHMGMHVGKSYVVLTKKECILILFANE